MQRPNVHTVAADIVTTLGTSDVDRTQSPTAESYFTCLARRAKDAGVLGYEGQLRKSADPSRIVSSGVSQLCSRSCTSWPTFGSAKAGFQRLKSVTPPALKDSAIRWRALNSKKSLTPRLVTALGTALLFSVREKLQGVRDRYAFQSRFGMCKNPTRTNFFFRTVRGAHLTRWCWDACGNAVRLARYAVKRRNTQLRLR